MDRFEYAIGLMSIVVGLGLAAVAMSLHRLLKHRAQVRWDGLAIGMAAFAAFTLIRMWYELWTLRELAEATNLMFYISFILEMFLVFLAAAAALPDDSDPAPERWDLHAYYERHSRYVWTLFVLFKLMYLSHFVYFVHASDTAGPSLSFWQRYMVLPFVVIVALAGTRSRRLHAGLLAFVFALEVVNSWSDGL